MTKEELLSKIKPSKRPEHLRKGQYIFNWIDEHYQIPEYFNFKNCSIARQVQFIDKIDCFHDDSKIDEFIDACLVRINNPIRISK